MLLSNCSGEPEVSADDELCQKLVKLHGNLAMTSRMLKHADEQNLFSVEMADSLVTEWNNNAHRFNKVLSGMPLDLVDKYKLTYIEMMYRNPGERPEPKKPPVKKADLRTA